MTNKVVNPQPTQQIPQEFTWHEASTNFVNQMWGHDGQGSTSGHGGQSSTLAHGGEGLTSAADENSPLTQVNYFIRLTREDGKLYGRGHQQGYPPQCDTVGHINYH